MGAQERLAPLLEWFPRDIWEGEGQTFVSPLTTLTCSESRPEKAFKRIPTKEEWARSRKYPRRVRKLEDPASLDVIQVPQLRTVNDPWLPRVENFECEETTKAFIPFIPLFLS